MKKGVLLTAILILSLAQVSAELVCSDNSEIIEDLREIDVWSARNINEVGVAVSGGDSILKRFLADLIVDAKKLSLSNETASEEVELISGKYTVTLVNSTTDQATISIEGNSKTILEREVEIIGDLVVGLASADGPSVSIIMGAKRMFLSNDQNPIEKVTFGNNTYFIEIVSASRRGATINVKKCKTGEIQNTEATTEIPENQTLETNTTIIESNTTEELTTCSDLSLDLQKACCRGELKNEKAFLNENGKCEVPQNVTTTNETQSQLQEEKLNIFQKFFRWLKNLFN